MKKISFEASRTFPASTRSNTSTMEVSLPKTLVNSISCFSSLSSSNTVKANLVQRYYQKIKETLELLKLVFEEVIVSELASDDKLDQVLQDIDESINEARELIENWHQMTSKVFFVMQIESVITKLRTLALGLEAFWLLNSLSPSLGVDSTSTCIESCIENIQQIHYEPISYIIKEAIRDQLDRTAPRTEHLEKISKSLSLLSNQELLMEAVALDKMKTKVTRGESHAEMESFDQLIALINYMHDCYVKIKQLDSINGVPIPADFCCPLSLELMSDPVIVASGQTYERAFIKQWLDQGFNVCPKTRQTLGHTNLIPNYTVKALIANWCELNDIKIPDPIKSLSLNMPPIFLSSADTNVYNASDICGSNHSPKKNLSKSPDRLTNGSISTNGTLEENHMHDEPLQTDNGIEASIARMSLPNSEEKKEAHSEERYTSSSSQTPNQLEDYHSEDQVVDEQSGGHSRSASASSAVSDNGYLQGAGDANSVARISSDLSNHTNNNISGEVSQNSPAAFASPPESEFLPRLSETRSRSQAIWRRSSERFVPRMISSQSMESRPDLSGVETQVRKLIEDLKSDSVDVQRDATAELRLLAKHNMDNRIVIANCGAINLLVGFLHSTDLKIQENAVTALLNLSINDNNKAAIANADAIDPLIHVLETGNTEAKENSAATLFSLSVIEENKVRIGRSRAIKPLVELLGSGTPRGKKDASTALFNLSIFPENKARIVQAGAVRHLVELMDPAAGMVDKAVAVLANLATIPEGRNAIGHEGGIPVLVEVVELGSARGKENAAAALLQLCTNSNRFCSQVLKEGAVPPLVALSQTGTARAKEKAQTLLSHFRNQRPGGAGRP